VPERAWGFKSPLAHATTGSLSVMRGPVSLSVDIDIIEQMFEYSTMSPALTLPSSPPERSAIAALQQQIRSLEASGISERVFPVSEVVQELFPEGGLRRGVVYQCDSSASLIWSLLAESSRQGVWCAVVGLPDLGVAAAEDMGVNVDRVVLVPTPGNQWLSVIAALSDVVGIVVLGAVPAPSERMLATLTGRLREREVTLLVSSEWPRTEARLSVSAQQWEGLGRGHGMLCEHRVSLTFTPRHGHPVRRCDLVIDAWGARHGAPHAEVTDLNDYRHAG